MAEFDEAKSEVFRDIIGNLALSFDGYAYLHSLKRDEHDFTSIVEPVLSTLIFSHQQNENWAAFFALQRYLHKLGGEQLPMSSREWAVYLLLYLHLYRRTLPSEFRRERRQNDVEEVEEQAAEDAAAWARQILSNGHFRSKSPDNTVGAAGDVVDPLEYYSLESYIFDKVHGRFHQNGELNAFDFFSIIIWKANRSKSTIAKKLLTRFPADLETAVRSLTAALNKADDDEKRFRYLCNDWRFRLPMASAILTVLWPDSFTVYDFRVCAQLGNKKFANLSEKPIDQLWVLYSEYHYAVIAAEPSTSSLREKDRALWAKNAIKQLRHDIQNCFGHSGSSDPV